MYLNSRLSRSSYSRVIDVVEGVPVIEHAHFKDRYRERVSDLYDLTKVERLKYTVMKNDLKQLIRDNISNVVTKDGKFKERLVNYTLKHRIGDERIVIDISALITSSLAKFDRNEPQEVNECYKEYVDRGVIKPYEPVVCIETVIATIRVEGEVRKSYTNLGDDQILKTYRLTSTRLITDNKLKEVTCNMRSTVSMCTDNAKSLIDAV